MQSSYAIRISVEDGKTVSASLEQIGSDGKKSFTDLGTAAAQAGESMSRMGSLVEGALVGLIGEKLKEAVKGAVEDLASLNVAAQQTGFTVKQISALRAIIADAGGNPNSADSGLKHFVEQVGQAEIGTGKLLPILKDLHIALKENGAPRNIVDILIDYTNAIQHANSPQEALFLSTKAFSEELGGPLAQALRSGKGNLEEMAQQAQASGQTIDAAMAESAEHIKKEFDTVWNEFKTGAEKATLETIDILSKWGDDINNIIVPKVNGFFAKMWQGLETVGDHIWDPFGNKATLDKVLSKGDWGPSARPVNWEGQPPAQTPSQYFRNMAGLPPEDDTGAIFAPGSGTGNYTAGGGITNDKARKSEEAIQKQIEGLKQINENLRESDEQQAVYNELKKHAVDLNSEDGQKIKYLVDEHIGLVAQQKLAAELAKDFSTALEQAVMNSKNLSQVLQNLGAMLEKTLINALMSPLMQAGGNVFNSLLSSVGFSSFLTPHAMGGVFGPDGSVPLKKYSGGGVADSPQIALFGEGSSKEAYVPLPDGRSIPVTLNGGGGGQSINFTINVNDQTGNGVSVDAQKSADGQSLEMTLRNATNQMIISGQLNRSMGAQFGMTPATIQR